MKIFDYKNCIKEITNPKNQAQLKTGFIAERMVIEIINENIKEVPNRKVYNKMYPRMEYMEKK